MKSLIAIYSAVLVVGVSSVGYILTAKTNDPILSSIEIDYSRAVDVEAATATGGLRVN